MVDFLYSEDAVSSLAVRESPSVLVREVRKCGMLLY
jgi:hypothetical protein